MKMSPCITLAFLLVSSCVHVAAQDVVQARTPEVSISTASAKTASVKDETAATDSDPVAEARRNYEYGLARYDSGNYEEAIVALKASTRLRPDDAQSHFLLGMAYSHSKSYKEAAESFKKAVRFRPDWAEAHFRLGMLSHVLGKRAQSADAYRRLVELNSRLANVLYKVIRETKSAEESAENMKSAGEFITAKLDTVLTSEMASETDKPVTENVSASTSAASTTQPTSISSPVDESTLTGVYKIGVGDVLDVRFLNASVNRSSLYTVVDGGLIDIPIAGGAMPVAGLTTDEVQTKIAGELKRRAVEPNAKISVGIRHYGSHSVIITGLVGSPGTKILRREAVPLYVILAEVQPRLDAQRATIMRSGAPSQVIELNDSAALGFLVRPGDVINITSRPQEFYYIAGRVNTPGQKTFQPGITLLQAILAAGGTTRPGDNNIELSREGENGLLSTTKINVKDIKSGKVQDPKLRPGDRIVVVN
jgi:protein involved in polysaccharide export with SLBB domain